ncbi:MAG: hypothetical protein C3F13_08155 [Anaerolineales bacterium]|nr:hypothetical protein [Anaerolineae bacterium]PWB53870.1 MAG: hypothetical protein C3F13_08155 [Anaerolineales bacterium]
MESHRDAQNLPNIDHLSVLAAMIVMAYILARFINLPAWQISQQLPGLYIGFTINVNLITAVLVALMTAAGANWLMSSHPANEGRQSLVHSILPALTALAIGIPLGGVPVGVGWWIGLISGAVILVLVLIAEYIAVDLQDVRLPWASAALSATSFALFLLFAGALRGAEVRLLFNVPALVFAAWLVSLRVTNLRLHGIWTIYESAIIAFLIGQVAAAFNYWPLTPVAFGLVLLGPSNALISLFCNLIEEKPFRNVIIEPVISLVVAWSAALVLR